MRRSAIMRSETIDVQGKYAWIMRFPDSYRTSPQCQWRELETGRDSIVVGLRQGSEQAVKGKVATRFAAMSNLARLSTAPVTAVIGQSFE